MGEKRSRSFYVLAAVFTAYVLFLYGPMLAIYILSFQGPDGGLTFPMNGVSLQWCGIQAVASARPRRHGTDGHSFGCGRHGLPQVVPWRDLAVLCRHRKPDHAVDHYLARHRAGIPAA